MYRGNVLGHHQLDMVVDSKLIVEIKAVESIHSVHVAQTVSYLRVTGLRLALLVNFNVPLLARGLRRIVR